MTKALLIACALLTGSDGRATPDQTNTNATVNTVAGAVRDEEIRAACVQGRRIICGRILEVRPDGLLVESGYTDLLRAPLNQTWLVPGTATATRDTSLVESDRPDAICAGRIWLTGLPKSRTLKPKVYDYVNLHAYPAGNYTEVLPGNQPRTIRRFAAGLETAIRLNRSSGESRVTGAAPASK